MRHAFCTTPEPHLLAEVIPTFPADATFTTGNAYFESYSVANAEAIDLRANPDDDAGRLMAKREGCTGAKVAIGELFVVRDIGATDTCGFDLDLKLASKRVSDGACFLRLVSRSTLLSACYEEDW